MSIRYLAVPALAVLTAAQGSGSLIIPRPASAPARARGVEPGTPQPQSDGFDRVLMHLAELGDARDDEIARCVAEAKEKFPDALERFRLATRTADLDVLKSLIRVLASHPSEQSAADLRYLLRNRALKGLTRKTLEALVAAAGPGAKEYLREELRNREGSVRMQAAELLARMVDASDLPFLMDLSQERNVELRRTAINLLGNVVAPEARARLAKALSEPIGGVAGSAARALVGHGVDAAPDLQARLRSPALDQGFGHAALTLTAIEDRSGTELLSADMVPHLTGELRGRDPFLRSASAIPLANLAFRGAAEVPEKEVVEALVAIVSPKAYFPEYGSCLDPALAKLALLSGRRGSTRPDAWTGWWSQAKEGFKGARLAIELRGEDAGRARLALEDTSSRLEVLAPEAEPSAAPATRPADFSTRVHVAVRLDDAGFKALVAELRAAGFMTIAAKKAETEVGTTLPVERTLSLTLDGRAALLSAPRDETPWFDLLARRVQNCVEAQRWQLFRDPVDSPDERAWWAREWPLFSASSIDTPAGRRRLVELIVSALPHLSPTLQDRGIADLMEIQELPTLLTESHGASLTAMAAAAKQLDARARRFLEISISCRSEANWQRVLDLVVARWEHGGRESLPRLFALQGVEKVIASLRDERPAVRASAAEELAGVRDPRAVEGVIALLSDPDPMARRSAVFAAGRQRSQGATPKLLEAARGEDPHLRRAAFVALGQVGGKQAFDAILRGATLDEAPDRMAAVRGLTALEGPEAVGAAEALTSIFVTHHKTPIGQLAADALRDRNHLLVRPELRRRLQTSDQELRREIIFLLAEGMDPLVVPDLISLLELNVFPSRCAQNLAAISGIDHGERTDRVALYRQWWERNKDRPLGQWLLEALVLRKHTVNLTPESLLPGAGLVAVPELTRIVEEAPDWYVRSLACAVLREVTGKDFGVVRKEDTLARLSAVAERYRGLGIVSGGKVK